MHTGLSCLYKYQFAMMKILRYLIALLLAASWSVGWAQSKSTFVFAKITDTVLPIERGSKYEDPLDAALKQVHLGEVTGGGSSLSKDKKIEWVGVDIELTDLTKGIPFVKSKLRQLGAPKGSKLEYEVNGKNMSVDIND
jgi:hypothetical protein